MRLRPDVLIFVFLLLGAGYAVWTQVDARPPTPSLPPIGTTVEDFTLKDIGDRDRRLSEFTGKKATVIYFWSIDCPCVDALEPRVKALIETYEPLGVGFVAVNSHPADKREDVLEKMGQLRATKYPMLLDPSQRVAWLAGGRRSTDLVVLDAEHRLRYRGSIDDSLRKPTKPYVAPVLDALIAGQVPEVAETPGYGCPYPGFEGFCSAE